MQLSENFKLEDMDQIKVVHDERVVLCLGLRATFYLENTEAKEVRLRIAQCVEEYIEMTQDHLRWFLPIGGGRYKETSKHKLPSPVDFVNKNDSPHEEFSILLTGAEHYDEANPYSLDMLAEDDYSGEPLGYLTATLPFSWLSQNKPGAFQQWVNRWNHTLSPYHGYAGLSAIQTVDYDEMRRTESFVYPFAMRFPCLDVDNALTLSRFLIAGIKGVNWLNVLSDKFLEKLGGKEALQKTLGAEFIFFDYPGGTMIQAGPTPQLGDVNRRNIPKYYKRLGSILKSIRAEYPHEYLEAPEGVDSLEKTKEWFARFD